MAIPKKIFTTWKVKNILDSKSPLILNGIANIKLKSPNWELEISDDQDMDYYLKSHLSLSDYQLIKNLGAVEKSDIWRLLKIYNEGGIYLDLDRFFNVNLNDILPSHIYCVLPICRYTDFSQDILVSEPNNPIFLKVFMRIISLRKSGVTDTYFLGPQTYMHVLTKIILGEEINSGPEKIIMERIFQKINQSSFMMSVIENPPYHTFVYRHNINEFRFGDRNINEWQDIKEDFYKRYNVKHWTGAW